MSAVLGCDEFGNGCGCADCMAESEERSRMEREYNDAINREIERAYEESLRPPTERP